MNTRSRHPPHPYHPSDAEIRDKALEIYIRSGWLPGRDLENWLEAQSELIAHPPAHPATSAPDAPVSELRSHSPHTVRRHD